jgi:hypothetical protein
MVDNKTVESETIIDVEHLVADEQCQKARKWVLNIYLT